MSTIDDRIKKVKSSDLSDDQKYLAIERLRGIKERCYRLLSHSELILNVKLNTIDDAEQILNWLSSPIEDKPMTSVLQRVRWNTHTVSKDEFELLEHIKEFKFYNN